MKALFACVTCCAASLLALPGCHKDDNPAGSGNNGGTTGELKITGWSPQRPYPDDIITITGTGFSDDDTANHVRLSGYQHFGKDLEVVSATATQLEVRIPEKDLAIYRPQLWQDAFRITVGNATYTHDKVIAIHAPLRIGDVTTPAAFLYKGIIPDRQVVIEITGFDPSEGGSFAVPDAHNGALTIDSVVYDPYTQYGTVRCSVPRNFMMEAPVPWQPWLDDSEAVYLPLVVHSHGHTSSYTTLAYFLPQTRVDSVRPTNISLEQLNGIATSGGQLFVTVYGRNLYGFVHGDIIPTQVIENYSDRFPVQIGGLNWKVPKRGVYPLYLQSRQSNDTGNIQGGKNIGSIYIN
jgi:hypothetical protein